MNGDFIDSGKTQRRHIIVKSVQHIGKEANKLEEQFYLGLNPEAQLEYGINPEQRREMMQYILQSISVHGAKNMADTAKLTERHALKISVGKAIPSEKALAKLHAAAKILDNTTASEQVLRQRVKAMMEEKRISARSIAATLETDPSNLAKVLSGDRNAGDWLVHAYEYLVELGDDQD